MSDDSPAGSRPADPDSGPSAPGPDTAEHAPAGAPTVPEPPAADPPGPSAAPPSAAPGEPGEPVEPRHRAGFLRELPFLVVVAFGLALLIKAFLVQAFFIPSGSMEQTLEISDRVLVNKLVYDFRDVRRGEVIVFNGAGSFSPDPDQQVFAEPTNPVQKVLRGRRQRRRASGTSGEKDFIKRVIGIPGDRVACCTNGHVTVQPPGRRAGRARRALHLREREPRWSFCEAGADETSCPPGAPGVLVPEGRLFVIGDHRCCSSDSRLHLDDGNMGTVPAGRGHRPGLRRRLALRPGDAAVGAGGLRQPGAEPAGRRRAPASRTPSAPRAPCPSALLRRRRRRGGEDVLQGRRGRRRRPRAAARLRRPRRARDPLAGAARRRHRGRRGRRRRRGARGARGDRRRRAAARPSGRCCGPRSRPSPGGARGTRPGTRAGSPG